jgi:hypothetical protein
MGPNLANNIVFYYYLVRRLNHCHSCVAASTFHVPNLIGLRCLKRASLFSAKIDPAKIRKKSCEVECERLYNCYSIERLGSLAKYQQIEIKNIYKPKVSSLLEVIFSLVLLRTER